MTEQQHPEPWLRGTSGDVPAITRAVLHALELASEDLERWCAPLSDQQLNARPFELAPVAFHIRHVTGSIDRLLCYAEGRQLTSEQMEAFKAESREKAKREELFTELKKTLQDAARRIRAFEQTQFDEPRAVGRRQLPTTVGGLLVHVADHTQRHVGQAITTAKVVMARPS